MGETITFTLALNEKERKLLEKLAKRERRSNADIIRRALTLYQRTQERKKEIAIIKYGLGNTKNFRLF
ncbi:MAG: ribbon-helix-helix protein, CopG family [Patescibacteria group bacterium]